MAYIAMAGAERREAIVMAYIVMAYIVMAYIAMAGAERREGHNYIGHNYVWRVQKGEKAITIQAITVFGGCRKERRP